MYVTSAKTSAKFVKHNFSLVPNEYKRFDNPAEYRVGVSSELFKLQQSLS